MPRHSQNHEKSPVDNDYEGLQLDTRARDPDKHLDGSKPQGKLDDDFDDHMNYINEKQAHAGFALPSPENPISPDPSYNTAYGTTFGGTTIGPTSPSGISNRSDGQLGVAPGPGSDPPPKEHRVCGLKRRYFWGLAGLTLGLIIAAAVVGGVIGGLRARNRHPPPPAPPRPANSTPPAPAFPDSQWADVMVGSPLSVVSYDLRTTDSGSKRQAYRIYYQSLLGNIKEAVANGTTSWQSARPIFTDAVNNTGLASITYLNGTNQQGSIFYVGNNGLLQEKRKIYNDAQYWEPGTLNSLNVPMSGNASLTTRGDDPQNTWDGYRMTVTYSTNFKSGPQARLFYHAQQMDGSNYVQEMIWTQNNDSWAQGATIKNAYPNSRLSATTDDKIGIIRLFFSSGNHTLQESVMRLQDPSGTYRSGESAPKGTGRKQKINKRKFSGIFLTNFLSHNSVELASISINGTTYLYHQESDDGIHELTITGDPGSSSNQESFNISQPLVASPNLPTGSNSSLYQPLTVARTVVPGTKDQLLVFWAEKPTGQAGRNDTGYGQLTQLSRLVGDPRWPATGMVQIPLGSDNSMPSN